MSDSNLSNHESRDETAEPELRPMKAWLGRASGTAFGAYCIAASFGTYFCMYAFRKPFTAGTYDDMFVAGIAYKTVLIAAQVSGYTLSKFLGIKLISEMPANRRAVSILALIGIAEFALLGFAIVPAPWNTIMLFINGLPLGMVFGLVLAFLEGRKVTEALTAGLCASFIISSGVVKSVGRWLIVSQGVSEFWMPFLTGLIFLPGLLITVWLLSQIPPPSANDIALRRERKPMYSEDRWRFLRCNGIGLGLLVIVFILLTILRSVRDDFAVEIWQQLAPGQEQPAIYSKTETLIAFAVVIINGLAIAIKSNRHALLGSLGLMAAGFLLVLMSLVGRTSGWLGPFPFMVLIGLGLYIPYVAFHTTTFERLIASVKEPANIGYLMYIADAVGYLGYVGVMIFRNSSAELDILDLFGQLAWGISIVSLFLVFGVIAYFSYKLPTESVAISSEA